jgi:hypothetical protein
MSRRPPSGKTRLFDRAFALRLWRESEEKSGFVRGSVVELASGRRRFFARFEELEEFLRARLSGAPDEP